MSPRQTPFLDHYEKAQQYVCSVVCPVRARCLQYLNGYSSTSIYFVSFYSCDSLECVSRRRVMRQ